MALDATALAGLVADKQVTPAELLALARQRADAVNPRLNAIVCRLDDVADRQAADPNLSGPFAGVPFLLRTSARSIAAFPPRAGHGRWPTTSPTGTRWSPSGSWTRGW